MAFHLPFETEIIALDQQLAGLSEGDSEHGIALARLQTLEREVYPNLTAYDRFLLSGSPLRPKTLDYVEHIFHDVLLSYNPEVHGDHLMIGGQAKIEIGARTVDVIIVGQQTGPTSKREDLLKLSVSEYQRWNQGMGWPDGYRKAVYFMNLAEQRGWPVIVFVDTPGADPSESAEEQGQAFAINEVIHKTTSLRTPNLSYIISQGASGGAVAITTTNRTIINQYATHMVISPGGCASILFRNRSPESIRKAADGLCLTSEDAIRQNTADEVVKEGLHPGHRYPQELLVKAKEAVTRNLAMILGLVGEEAERARREKFYAMGVWGESQTERSGDQLAKKAVEQEDAFQKVRHALADYLAQRNSSGIEPDGKTRDETNPAAVSFNGGASSADLQARREVARMIYAVERSDAKYVTEELGCDAEIISRTQWAQMHEYVLERRYGHRDGDDSLHPNGGMSPYRRQHPVDWIRWIADPDSFREFAQTIRYLSIDQLHFPGYEQALARGIKGTGLESGLITGTALIAGCDAVLTINNFGLVGSSLCDEIGEKYVFAAHQALKTKTPLVSVSMGGGARMQEGTPSMHRNIPKAQHALNELAEGGVAHISVISDPTLGGTAISYGLRGDYMIVVKGSANIGFSGKRVVEQFQGRKVAADFQHGSWLLHRGFVDERVSTEDLSKRIGELLKCVKEGGDLSDLQTRRSRLWKPTEQVPLKKTAARSASSNRRPRAKKPKILNA